MYITVYTALLGVPFNSKYGSLSGIYARTVCLATEKHAPGAVRRFAIQKTLLTDIGVHVLDTRQMRRQGPDITYFLHGTYINTYIYGVSIN